MIEDVGSRYPMISILVQKNLPKSDANLKSISLRVCLYSSNPAKTRWDSSLQLKRQLKILSRIINKSI